MLYLLLVNTWGRLACIRWPWIHFHHPVASRDRAVLWCPCEDRLRRRDESSSSRTTRRLRLLKSNYSRIISPSTISHEITIICSFPIVKDVIVWRSHLIQFFPGLILIIPHPQMRYRSFHTSRIHWPRTMPCRTPSLLVAPGAGSWPSRPCCLSQSLHWQRRRYPASLARSTTQRLPLDITDYHLIDVFRWFAQHFAQWADIGWKREERKERSRSISSSIISMHRKDRW